MTKEDSQQALDEQLGGNDEPNAGYNKYTKFSNAYMLVYIRESDWNTIMCQVSQSGCRKHCILSRVFQYPTCTLSACRGRRCECEPKRGWRVHGFPFGAENE